MKANVTLWQKAHLQSINLWRKVKNFGNILKLIFIATPQFTAVSDVLTREDMECHPHLQTLFGRLRRNLTPEVVRIIIVTTNYKKNFAIKI